VLGGSGTLRVLYRDVTPAAYVKNAGDSHLTATFTIAGLSLSASGAVTITPSTDLALYAWGQDAIRVQMTISNIGSEYSHGATVTISGYREPVSLSTTYCHGSGYTVTCRIPQLSSWGPPGVSYCAGDPGCIDVTVGMDLHWKATRLTVTLVGDYPDPVPSNNTVVVFQDYPTANGQPSGAGAGRGSGTGGTAGPAEAAPTEASPDPTASSSGPQPSDVDGTEEPGTGAQAADQPTRYSGPRTATLMVVASLLGLGGGGVLTHLALRRRPSRRGQPAPEDGQR
jgi:hypothetical protein